MFHSLSVQRLTNTMSHFDSLLDLEDTGTTSSPKQQTGEDFDPYGAPDSNVNGGSGGDLLDLDFDMQVWFC